MIIKTHKKLIVVLLIHTIILGFLLYPTIMELFNGSAEALSYDEITQLMEEKPHWNDGNFWDGEIAGGRVRYVMEIGPFRFQSIIA